MPLICLSRTFYMRFSAITNSPYIGFDPLRRHGFYTLIAKGSTQLPKVLIESLVPDMCSQVSDFGV